MPISNELIQSIIKVAQNPSIDRPNLSKSPTIIQPNLSSIPTIVRPNLSNIEPYYPIVNNNFRRDPVPAKSQAFIAEAYLASQMDGKVPAKIPSYTKSHGRKYATEEEKYAIQEVVPDSIKDFLPNGKRQK